MRILFVENRYGIRIWDAVGRGLAADGHEIHWLVQNPAFMPVVGQSHTIPFPRPSQRSAYIHDDITRLKSDRAVNFFGGSTDHYNYYIAQIQITLDTVKPDVVFGEPTLFHELITIELSRRMGIPYLFPSSTRYPPNRIAFHLYDTLEIHGGCGEQMPLDAATRLRDDIAKRRVVPSYMIASKISTAERMSRAIGDKLRISASWLRGERFNTPSPWRKAWLDLKQQSIAQRWDDMAHSHLVASAADSPWVLYAMQMQPESNIDIWGFPWNDQVYIINEAATALAKVGAKLVVKPNPKSKYELSQALLDLCGTHENIIPLQHAVKMEDIFLGATAVLSVTGTVLMEAVMKGKPVAVLGQHPMAQYPGVTRIDHPAEVANIVERARIKIARKATDDEAIQLLRDLHAKSYEAVLYDPLNQFEFGNPENLKKITQAFQKILRDHSTKNN